MQYNILEQGTREEMCHRVARWFVFKPKNPIWKKF
jgi:hypothetical protein